MSKITLDNLSDNLKEYLNGLGLTSEQVNELINNVNGDLNDLYTTNKSSLVGAINELFQNANNGKELIANAIGEPLNASDTFSAMSSDINGLLSQFKTNMMNNGVTVESSDKFKSLIDKIATLADNEGKGVQFVQGTSTVVQTLTTYTRVSGDTNGYYYIEIPNLTFEPLFIIAKKNAGAAICFINASLGFYYSYYNTSGKHITLHTYSDGSGVPIAHNTSGDTSIDFTNIKLPVDISTTGTWDWYAIGVGEEDTTLRDSLADILENKGVDVTEEDDMASLIGKVDSIQTGGGLDIISATSLPANGRENQICVITDSPVNDFIVVNFKSDIPEGYNGIALILSTTNTNNPVETSNGYLTIKLHFLNTLQNNNSKSSYVFKNGSWQILTEGVILMITNTEIFNTDIFGYFDSRGNGAKALWEDNYGYNLNCNGDWDAAYLKNNIPIDFSKYSKITFTISNPKDESSYFGCRDHFLVITDTTTKNLELIDRFYFSANGTYTVDISGLYEKGYILIYVGNYDDGSMSWFNVSYLAIE